MPTELGFHRRGGVSADLHRVYGLREGSDHGARGEPPEIAAVRRSGIEGVLFCELSEVGASVQLLD